MPVAGYSVISGWLGSMVFKVVMSVRMRGREMVEVVRRRMMRVVVLGGIVSAG